MCVCVCPSFSFPSPLLPLSLSCSLVRFVDQYLSIGTTLPTNYNIYGLGEHVLESFKLRYDNFNSSLTQSVNFNSSLTQSVNFNSSLTQSVNFSPLFLPSNPQTLTMFNSDIGTPVHPNLCEQPLYTN